MQADGRRDSVERAGATRLVAVRGTDERCKLVTLTVQFELSPCAQGEVVGVERGRLLQEREQSGLERMVRAVGRVESAGRW